MAWVSVHESVFGPKLWKTYGRLGCSQWEAAGILLSLWIFGLKYADNDGCIPFAGREVIARNLYSFGAGSNLDASRIVDVLIETGWLDEKQGGLYIHDWDIWQEQWYKAKERRKSEAERKRKNRKKDSGETEEEVPCEPSLDETPCHPQEQERNVKESDVHSAETASECVSDEGANSEGPAPKKRERGKETGADTGFEAFWETYPRQVGKGEANKCYRARLKDGWSPEELLEAARNYAAEVQRRRTDQQYIKHPKTFLSANTPFTDYLPKREASEPVHDPDADPWADWR